MDKHLRLHPILHAHCWGFTVLGNPLHRKTKEGTTKTAVLSQLIFGIVGTLVYLPAVYFISNAIGTSTYLPIYLIAGFYILTYYLITVFESVLQATKPQTTGYGFIIQEIVKVVIALSRNLRVQTGVSRRNFSISNCPNSPNIILLLPLTGLL